MNQPVKLFSYNYQLVEVCALNLFTEQMEEV